MGVRGVRPSRSGDYNLEELIIIDGTVLSGRSYPDLVRCEWTNDLGLGGA